MDEHEFDQFAEEYRRIHASSIRVSGEGPEFFAEYKIADVHGMVIRDEIQAPRQILDFGAGVGGSVPYFQKYFGDAELTCLDVSRRSIEIGQNRFGDYANFVHYDGHSVPLPDCTIDLVFLACVLHHIKEVEHVAVLAELHRLLRPGGSIIIYEHNPLNFLTVRAVNQCEFDRNAVLIRAKDMLATVSAAGFAVRSCRYRLFFPRWLGALRPIERLLRSLPFGAQYCVHGIRR